MTFNKIWNNGYCENCEINHNCLNCPYMDYLFYSQKINNIIKKEKNSIKNICECWAEIIWNYSLCWECYQRNKINKNY